MVQVTKIGYAGFNTTHMEAMLAYYTEVIGCTLEERGGDGAAYLSNALDHHSIALYPSAESGLRHIGFQIHSGQSLQEVSTQL
jgi:catechol-2,3-dioxygenase